MNDYEAQHDADIDLIEKGASQARRLLDELERARDEQPAKLAAMRIRADEQRDATRAAEPWADTVNALPTVDEHGNLTGMMGLPSLDAKAVWGTRLAFDLVSRDLPAKEILSELFSDIKDIDHLMLVLAEACEVFAENIVAPMLERVETHGGDHGLRVRLADAARNAWATRIAGMGE